MKKTILLCTSPLQVVNAKSVIDYLAERTALDSENYVIMVHPLLLDSTKKMIRDLSDKLGYAGVLDLTDVYLDLNNGVKYFLTREKMSLMQIGRSIKKKIENYHKTVSKIRRLVELKIGVVDEVFYRMRYKQVDALFVWSLSSAKNRYGIEDGIGDYRAKYWKYKMMNKYEIVNTLKSSFKSYGAFICSGIFTGRLKTPKLLYLKPKIAWDNSFTNISYGKNSCVGEYFLKNIQKLYAERPIHKKRKVVIFGSLIPDPRFDMDIVREVEIYNSVIDKIKKKQKVGSSEIWYKPHPRLEYKSWMYKKNNLNCTIYNYDQNVLGEIELCNPHLKGVYSIGSTSLLYAKALFQKDSYLIDIRKEPVHPAAYKKYATVLKPYNLGVVTV